MAVYKCDSCGTIWAANDVPIACVKFGCGSRLVTEIQGATPAAETPPPPRNFSLLMILTANLTAIPGITFMLLLFFGFINLPWIDVCRNTLILCVVPQLLFALLWSCFKKNIPLLVFSTVTLCTVLAIIVI